MLRGMNGKSNKETRREARRHELSNGRLVADDGIAFIDCTILDTSASGAQIRVGQGRIIPDNARLVNVRARTAHDFVVVWQREGRIGLKFLHTYPLSSNMPEHLGHLRKHWLDCACR
jgi:hypothetical protein